jgi:hypothetical protein
MESADKTRKHWASLLAGNGPLHTLALGTWLGLAASALGGDSAAEPAPIRAESSASASQHGAARTAPDNGETAGWLTAMAAVFDALTQAADNLQGTAWTWMTPRIDNPLARLMSHPAAVVGGENSAGRLSMQAAWAWADFMQSALAHQALQAQGWAKAYQRFAAEFLASEADEVQPVVVTSLDDLVTHWGTAGEATLQEHSRSERFLKSQADMLRKAMGYRILHRRMVEAASRANDLPTLTDLDEAFASIHAMRGEIRCLQRLVEAHMSPPGAPNAPAAGPKATSSAAVRRARRAA